MKSATSEQEQGAALHCGASVELGRGVLGNDTRGGFHPYHLVVLGRDAKVWGQEDFERWRRDFCFLGYITALYIRAMASLAKATSDGTSAAALRASASSDLNYASDMLGRCREMDFLDRSVWGLHSIDIDLKLLRSNSLQSPDPPLVPVIGEFVSFAAQFPEEADNAAHHVWHAHANYAISTSD